MQSIREGNMGSYGHNVQEIRARSRDLSFVDFVYEGKQSNFDAHVLARMAFVFLMNLVDMFSHKKSSVYDELSRHV